MHARKARGALILAALASGLALAVLAAAPLAQAGEWVHVSCVNPDQSPAGSQGWLTMAQGGGYGSTAGTGCGPGESMFAMLSSAAAVGVGSAETLHYVPPAGSTLNGGTIYVGMHADGRGYDASGTAVAYTPQLAYDAANVIFQCASGLAPCAAGNDYTGTLTLPPSRGGDLYLSAGCGGTPGYICNEGASNGAWSRVELWWANLRLSNGSSPTASTFAGTLLEAGARGAGELSFTAGDVSGPGVYSVRIQADGRTLWEGTPDQNLGSCVAVGSSAGALMFDASQPCKQSENVDESVETTGLSDGPHVLRVSVSDAAGNTSVVYDAAISTHNAPVASVAPSLGGEALPGATLQAQPGSWSAPTGAGPVSYTYSWQRCEAPGACQAIPGASSASYTLGPGDIGSSIRVLTSASDRDGSETLASAMTAPVSAPVLANGAGASRSAQIRLIGPASLRRAYAQRGLRVAGQLLDTAGRPIAGANLEIGERVQGSASSHPVGFAQTGADGSFGATVAPGPSRELVVGYRAFSNDPGDDTQAAVNEIVSASVALRVDRRHVRSDGAITLSGQVPGPVPAQGVVVELLVHYRGSWQPFRDPRVDAHGRFRVRYRFQGALGRFPFRAQLLSGQAGYPYDGAQSTPVIVRTG